MSEFIRVARVDEVPDPGKQAFEVDDRQIVLIHLDGKFYCIDDVCTHDGGPLSDGELCDHRISCPRHGAQFDICTGAALTMPATEATVVHDVKVSGDDVHVRLRE
jgi:3-phenylpropionate/trans-cinnamate dioxygenase ferredoxin component